MNIARSISRFSVITLLSVALLAAFGLRTLLEHVSPRRASLLTLAACLGVGLEFVVLPIPTTPLDVPAVIETWRADPERFAILDLPPDYKTGGEAMYYWTIHRKPTVIGYHSQIVPYSLIDGVTAVRALVSPAPDILVKPQLTAAEVLNFFNIRYAALHKSAQEEDVRRIAVQLNEQWSSGAVISDDPALTVYAVPQTPLPSLVVMFDQALSQAQQTGWDQASPFGDGRIWRWMRNNGRVLLYTQTGGQLNLQVDATSLARPRRLVIRVNDEKVHSTRVLPDRTRHISVEGIRLQAGTNSLSFHSVEPPEQPSALGLNDDDRYLSIAFSQLSLQIE